MKCPFWITNLKNYPQAAGGNGTSFAAFHARLSQKFGRPIAVAPNAFDLSRVIDTGAIAIAQHLDSAQVGASTGGLVPQLAKKMGVDYTLLNHSEKRLGAQLIPTIQAVQAAGIHPIVCVETPEELSEFSKQFTPLAWAFEPPELIGSASTTVAEAHPQSIADCVKIANGVPVLVGAGIHRQEDLRISLELGAQGFLVASAVVKADNPEQWLEEILTETLG